MTRSSTWAVGRPAWRFTISSVGRPTSSKSCTISTTACVNSSSNDEQQSSADGVRPPHMPRLSNRMRRLARAHPEHVAGMSPSAVEDANAIHEARALAPAKDEVVLETPTENNEQPSSNAPESPPGRKRRNVNWTKSQVKTPEFYQWLNSYPEGHQAPEEASDDEDHDEQDEVELPPEDAVYAGYDGDESTDRINIGKEFLMPRVRPQGFDLDIFSSEMLASRDKVLTARTRAQLKIAHDRLKNTEATLRDRARAYSTLGVGWGEPVPPPLPAIGPDGRPRPKSAAAGVSKGGTPGETTNRVIYGPSETFAYVYHRMIPNYAILHRVMAEVRDTLPELDPRRMFDFGSGPGTATMAAWEAWGGDGGVSEDDEEEAWEGSQLSEVRLVEESQAMTDASKIMLESLTKGGKVRIGYGSSLVEEAKAASRGEVGGKKFDLVVASYSLSHLTTHTARSAATAVLWSLVSPGGVLLVVEDGSAQGSHTVRTARQTVLDSTLGHKKGDAESKAGGKGNNVGPYVVGPCQHDKACPLKPENGELCRFTQKVPLNPIDVTKSTARSVPFSYVVIRKGAPESTVSRSDATESRTSSSSVELLKAFIKGRKAGADMAATMESLGTDGISDEIVKRNEWARLIRKPIKAERHTVLDVCTPDGDIQRKIETKTRWKGAPGVYVAARKSQLGGLWPYLDRKNVKSTPDQNKAVHHVADVEKGEWVIPDMSDDEFDEDDMSEEARESRRRKRRQMAVNLDAEEGASGFGFGAERESPDDEDRPGKGAADRRRDNIARAAAAKYRDLHGDS